MSDLQADTCTDERPGLLCSPTRHDPACRFAGTERKVMRLSARRLAVIEALASLKGARS